MLYSIGKNLFLTLFDLDGDLLRSRSLQSVAPFVPLLANGLTAGIGSDMAVLDILLAKRAGGMETRVLGNLANRHRGVAQQVIDHAEAVFMAEIATAYARQHTNHRA